MPIPIRKGSQKGHASKVNPPYNAVLMIVVMSNQGGYTLSRKT